MDKVHAATGVVDQSEGQGSKGKVVTLQPKEQSPYVVLLTLGKPPDNVVQAILETGYVKTAESDYGGSYTTQFKRAGDN